MKIASIMLLIGTAAFLSGCSSTGFGGAGDAMDTQPVQAAKSSTKSPAVSATSPKLLDPAAKSTQQSSSGKAGQPAFPGQKYMSNQVVRSLKVLTAEGGPTEYPVIADAPAQKRRLLTPEERAKLEAELRDLAQ